jgi:hypothetical protein
MIWPSPELRSADDLWMGFVDKYHNKYQTGGLQHLLAKQIRTEVGSVVFDSYFSFSIIRNPWDRVVSQFASMARRPDLRAFIGMQADASLKQYLHLIGKRRHVQWDRQVRFLYDDNGNCLVDFIARFEALESSIQTIMSRLGMDLGPLRHDNRGMRGRYQSYYDAETREMVAALYAEDIQTFGYNFEAS